mmetsp:Transcript_1688/g.2510  ORF Transcript_1688/g.2510 Transcript_1688/m.2510 type:complete len:223 (-) Transcript_1688:213-881(-)
MDFDYMIKDTVPPLTLFDFGRDGDVSDFDNKEWREGNDSDIGGMSNANMEVISEKDTRFLRWKGVLSNNVPANTRAVRSGYCAIQSPIFPFGGADLNEWDALRIKYRLEKSNEESRRCVVNLKVQSFFPDDLYSGYFPQKTIKTHPLKPGPEKDSDGWEDVILPFEKFMLSSRGRMKEVQMSLDTVKLEHMGFTMADGVDGDFQLDIANIEAICLGDDQDLW